MPTRTEQFFSDAARDKRTALVAYLTIGYPSVEDSLACARAALAAGADILELGVPFSDPTADGPTIAAASFEAIQRGGSLRAALEIARTLRAESDAAGSNKILIVFTYCNPIFAYGEAALPPAAKAAGVDGLLVVDLPPEEGETFRRSCAEHDLAVIPLLAPTSDSAREQAAFAGASGFVYYVSMTGVTGSKTVDAGGAGQAAHALKGRSPLPVVVGFGIDSPAKAREVADFGVDGVVVGSQIVRVMGQHATTEARVQAVAQFVAQLRAALDA
ncbi:MAG: tryptophan synthase subunit alpha [Pseudomonadota bacterium]|jgi:tryptophan synthase alpha chain